MLPPRFKKTGLPHSRVIFGEALNKLCNALNELALNLDKEITPVTLIDYTHDYQPSNKENSPNTSAFSKAEQFNERFIFESINNFKFFYLLIFTSEVLALV